MSILAALLLALPHRVYVSNEASDDVSVIENDAVVARIAVGKRPRGIKLGTGGKLYVAVSGSPRAGPGQREAGDIALHRRSSKKSVDGLRLLVPLMWPYGGRAPGPPSGSYQLATERRFAHWYR